MNATGIAMVAALVAVSQTLGGPAYRIGGLRPDLLLAVVIYVSFYGPRFGVLSTACLVGLARDVASMDPVGAGLVGFPLAALVSLWVRTLYHREALWLRVAGVFLATAVGELGILFGTTIRERMWTPPPPWLIPGTAAYTAILAPALFIGLDRMRPFLRLERPGFR